MRVAEYGETYYLFALFRDMMFNDTHIQTEFGKRVMAVIGQKQSIQPFTQGPGGKPTPDDLIAAEVIEDMIANCDNWMDGQLHLMNGHIWPVAAAEKIFEPVNGSDQWKFRHPVRYRLKELAAVPYPLFNYRVSYWGAGQQGIGTGPMYSNYPAYVGNGNRYSPAGMTPQEWEQGLSNPVVNVNGKGSLAPDSPIIWNRDDWEPDIRFYSTMIGGMINWDLAASYKPDSDRHVIHRGHFLAGFRDNWGAVMRGLLFLWFFSANGRDWFARFMERYGNPFLLAYVNTNAKDQVDLVTKACNQSTKLGALIVPHQAKIELQQAMVSNAADGYEKFLEFLNRQKSNVIVGQELSTKAKDTGMGSGTADLQGDVRQDIRKHDERKLSDTERKQIFEHYLRVNGYKGRAPNSIWGGLSMDKAALFAKVLLELKKSGLKPVQRSLVTVSENLGFEVEFDESENTTN